MKKTIRQGVTFQGKWNFASFIIVLAGLILIFYFSFPIAGSIIVAAFLPVMLAIRGTDISFSDKTVRRWIWWYGLKTGKTESFAGYTFAELRSYYSCHTMGCRSVNGTYTARTFEILFGGPDLPKILIAEIPKYDDARKILGEICSSGRLELVDSFESIMLHNRHLRQNSNTIRR